LSENNNDALFIQAMNIATERWKMQDSIDFVSIFGTAWNEIASDKRLSDIFGVYELHHVINSNSSNNEVLHEIRNILYTSFSLAKNVLHNRIERFNATVQTDTVIGDCKHLIVVSGVEDTARLFRVLQAKGNFEFWETFACRTEGVTEYIIFADRKIKELADVEPRINDILVENIDTTINYSNDEKKIKEQYPLLSLLSLNTSAEGTNQYSCVAGRAHYSDTARINKLLAIPNILAMKPNSLRFVWTGKPVDENGIVYELIALKMNPRFGNEAPLAGDVIVDTRLKLAKNNPPTLMLQMNSEGSKIWARLTKNNINRQIAIVIDGYVYSHPTVMAEITGGHVSITGNFSKEDIVDLENILNSGKIVIPLKILQQ
jgi:SecD/SecF fusion protein